MQENAEGNDDASRYWIKSISNDEAIYLYCDMEGKKIAMELNTSCTLSFVPIEIYFFPLYLSRADIYEFRQCYFTTLLGGQKKRF